MNNILPLSQFQRFVALAAQAASGRMLWAWIMALMIPKRRESTLVLGLSAIVSLINGSALFAQPPASSPSALFVPDDYVPVSDFVVKAQSGSAVMTVDKTLLTWLLATPNPSVLVAIKAGTNNVVYSADRVINVNAGTVTFSATPAAANCVVVSEKLKQTLPIVTHWSSDGTPGGKQLKNAFGGIGSISVDSVSGDMTASLSIVGGNGQFYWATNTLNLFSDGSGVYDDADVPSYEVYIAENYSLYQVANLAAIRLSDLAREHNGLPIAHRNDVAELANDLPILQIAHARIIAPETVYNPAGNEQSLATFVLPPGWTAEASPSELYPILFTGFYDIHASTFISPGVAFVDSIAKVYMQSARTRRAIGILWNGGGTSPCQTTQQSAFGNAKRLINEAAVLLNADPHRILLSGGSRGATTALELATSLGVSSAYTVRYVNADNPEVKFYDLIYDFANPTYDNAFRSIDPVTGFIGSWNWPGSSGQDLCLQNLFGVSGTAGQATINGRSLDSTAAINALKQEGTQVVLRIGTHDPTKPITQLVTYVEHLVAANVPLQCGIFYRFGHVPPTGTLPSDYDLINLMFEGSPPLTNLGIRYFGRDQDDYSVAVDITQRIEDITGIPGYVPFAVEMPILVGAGQSAKLALVGQPGTAYTIRLTQVPVQTCAAPPPNGVFSLLATGTLSTGGLFGTAVHTIAGCDPQFVGCNPTVATNWWIEVDYTPPPPPNTAPTTYTLGQGAVAPPLPNTLFQFAQCMVDFPILGVSPSAVLGWSIESRTGGLSEDGRFLPPPP